MKQDIASEDVLKVIIAFVVAFGFWNTLCGGPMIDVYGKGDAEPYHKSRPEEMQRHVVRNLTKHKEFKNWSKFMKVELRLKLVKDRFEDCKHQAEGDEPTDSS